MLRMPISKLVCLSISAISIKQGGSSKGYLLGLPRLAYALFKIIHQNYDSLKFWKFQTNNSKAIVKDQKSPFPSYPLVS